MLDNLKQEVKKDRLEKAIELLKIRVSTEKDPALNVLINMLEWFDNNIEK